MGINYILKIIKHTLILSGTFLFSVSTQADTAEIPNTFTAGQPAVAQQVNDNFTALKTAIDGNAAKLPVLRDGNGAVKGTIITVENSTITLMSESSYIFEIHSATGELLNQILSYTQADCGGVAYAQSIQTVSPEGAGYLYVPAGTLPVAISQLSSRLEGSGACYNDSEAQARQAYPTSINVPAITGVENAPLTMPLTIGTQ